MMEILTTKKEDSKISFEIEYKGKEWKEVLDEEIVKATKSVKVEGFRKGKVPAAMAKKNIDMPTVYTNAIHKSINKVLNDLDKHEKVKKLNLDVYPTPSVDVKTFDDNSLVFNATFFIMPKVVIDNYKKMDVELDIPKVDSKEIENEIFHLLEKEKLVKPKEGQAIAKGDEATFDFVGFIDNKEFPGGKAENFKLEIGSNQFIPGFEDNMIGLKIGDEKDISIRFPKNYHEKTLADKPVIFKIKIHAINEIIKPKLDDEFVKNLKFDNVRNVAELKAFLKESILGFKKQQANQKNVIEINKAIYKTSKFDDIPQVMIDDEMKKIHEQYLNQLKQMKTKEEDFLKMVNKTKKDIEAEIVEQAKSNIVVYAALDEIIKKEKIDANKKEIEDRYNVLSQTYHKSVDEIKQLIEEDIIKDALLHEKAILNLIEWNSKNK